MQPESLCYDCLDIMMRLENVYYDCTTKIRFIRIFNAMNELHSDVGPSFIAFNIDGSIDEERYYINGLNVKNIKYKNNVPTVISIHNLDTSRYEYYYNGRIVTVDFYKKGLLTDNGLEPARTIYKYEENIKILEYYSNGRLYNSEFSKID